MMMPEQRKPIKKAAYNAGGFCRAARRLCSQHQGLLLHKGSCRRLSALSMALILVLAMALASGCGDGSGTSAGQTAASGSDSQAAGEQQSAAVDTSGSAEVGGNTDAGGDTDSEMVTDSDSLETQQQSGDAGSASNDEDSIYHLSLLADKSLESYDSARVKEIIIDPEGSSFVFWTERTLTDLKLIGVDYDGDQFMEKQIFCSYDEFTDGDALLITHFFSEEIADLKLTFYDDQGQAQALYITQDGQNAAPVMVPEAHLLFY